MVELVIVWVEDCDEGKIAVFADGELVMAIDVDQFGCGWRLIRSTVAFPRGDVSLLGMGRISMMMMMIRLHC